MREQLRTLAYVVGDMRQIIAVLLVTCSGAMFTGSPVGIGSASARGASACTTTRTDGRVLVRTTAAVVTDRHRVEVHSVRTGRRAEYDTYYGCLRRVGRWVLLGRTEGESDGTTWLEGFRLAGPYVTFIGGKSIRYLERVEGRVEQYDLRNGRRTFAVFYTGEYGSGPDGEVRDAFVGGVPPVVVAADGSAAWVTENTGVCGSQLCDESEETVVVHGRRGTQVVVAYHFPVDARDPLRITDLGISAHRVRWVHLGESLSAAVP